MYYVIYSVVQTLQIFCKYSESFVTNKTLSIESCFTVSSTHTHLFGNQRDFKYKEHYKYGRLSKNCFNPDLGGLFRGSF